MRSQPEVAQPLLVMAGVGTVALNFPTTFPSMVHFGFDLGAGAVGTAMSVSAIGSILGGIYVAGVEPHPRRTLAIALSGFGVTCAAVAFAPTFWTFVALSIPLRFASASVRDHRGAAAQHRPVHAGPGDGAAPDRPLRQPPIGAVLVGVVIQVTSARVPFALGGLSALLAAAAVGVRRRTTTGDLADLEGDLAPLPRSRTPARDHLAPGQPSATVRIPSMPAPRCPGTEQ